MSRPARFEELGAVLHQDRNGVASSQTDVMQVAPKAARPVVQLPEGPALLGEDAVTDGFEHHRQPVGGLLGVR
jgi:hypothetical protein